MARLGDVCKVVSGSTPKTSIAEYWDGNVKWITPAELDEDSYYITDSVRHISEKGRTKTGLSYMPVGTVILSSRAPIGKTAIAGCELCCNQGFKNLICSDAINNEYLYYFLKNSTEYLNSLGRGATFKEISKSIVEDIEIPLPCIENQRSIAARLRSVDQILSLRKQQLAKLDELVKSQFIELFGAYSAKNCKRRIGDYADVLGGYAFKSDLFCTDAIPVIRISNINDGRVTLDYSTCFSKDFWEKNKRFRAERMDIMMAMSGATTGKAGLYASSQPALINQRVACIRAFPNKACPEFLFVATQLEWMYDLIQETSAGCAQPNISGRQIENMPVPDASYEEQRQFASFVEQTDKSKLSIQQSIDQLETLKKSLMQQYFG